MYIDFSVISPEKYQEFLNEKKIGGFKKRKASNTAKLLFSRKNLRQVARNPCQGFSASDSSCQYPSMVSYFNESVAKHWPAHIIKEVCQEKRFAHVNY